MIAYEEELQLIIDSKVVLKANFENIYQIPLTQHFHCNIKNFASGDISNYNTNIHLNGLINAIEESEDILLEEKDNLLIKLQI